MDQDVVEQSAAAAAREPGSPRRVVLLAVAAVLLVIAGGTFGALIGRGQDDDAAPLTSPTASPTATSTSSPGAPTGEPTQEPTQQPSAVAAPTAPVDEPWAWPGSDFALLVGAELTPSGDASLTFDRAQWLTGEAYDAWVAEHGPPENDYVIVNENPRLRTVTVPADALFVGSIVIVEGGDAGPTVVTAEEFVDGANRYADTRIPIWLFHATTDLDSAVTGVQEQFVP